MSYVVNKVTNNSNAEEPSAAGKVPESHYEVREEFVDEVTTLRNLLAAISTTTTTTTRSVESAEEDDELLSVIPLKPEDFSADGSLKEEKMQEGFEYIRQHAAKEKDLQLDAAFNDIGPEDERPDKFTLNRIGGESTERYEYKKEFRKGSESVKPVTEGFEISGYSRCSAGQFQCVNGTSLQDGSYCIGDNDRCDSVADCSDGSDEADCVAQGCPNNFQVLV